MGTVIRIVKNLLWSFYKAVQFAALDYDAKLQLTKTPKERYIIWGSVATAAILFVIFLVYLAGLGMDKILNMQMSAGTQPQ